MHVLMLCHVHVLKVLSILVVFHSPVLTHVLLAVNYPLSVVGVVTTGAGEEYSS